MRSPWCVCACVCVLRLTFKLIDFTKHATNIMLLNPTHTSYFQNFVHTVTTWPTRDHVKWEARKPETSAFAMVLGKFTYACFIPLEKKSKRSRVAPLLGQGKTRTNVCRLARWQVTLSLPFTVDCLHDLTKKMVWRLKCINFFQ